MKIILVPPVLNPVSGSHLDSFIPVGLQSLMGSLHRPGIDAEIYRPHLPIIQDVDFVPLARDILKGDPDIIGFSTWCDSFPHVLLAAEQINHISPSTKLLFGGPQATALAEKLLAIYPYLDYVLMGEADFSLPELIQVLENGNTDALKGIGGLIYRDGKNIQKGTGAGLVSDMDSLPVPEYETDRTGEIVDIDAGRGCPYRCTYCSTSHFFSKKYRLKSVERLMSEIEHISQKNKISWIGISHDMFTLKQDFILEFSREMKKFNQKRSQTLYWTCSARTDCVNEYLVDRMYDSGCRAIFYGLESGSDKIQKQILKNLNVDKSSEIIRYTAGKGMSTVASFILGFPDETIEDLDLTLKSYLLQAANGAHPQLSILSILPGTPIYEQYLEDLHYDGQHSSFSNIHITPKTEELIRQSPEIFSSFYYLPNRHIPRKVYLGISRLAAYVESFIPTLVLIRDYLERDIKDFSLVSYLEQNFPWPETDPADSPGSYGAELFFLVEKLKDYIWRTEGRGLPPYVLDVLRYDMIKATMLIKFNYWRKLESAGKSPWDNERAALEDGSVVYRYPFWDTVTTAYNIYNHILNPRSKSNSFRKGKYNYLVLPVDHRHTYIYKIPQKELPLYHFEFNCSLKEIIQKHKDNLPEDRILQVTRRMLRLGLISPRYETVDADISP